MANIKKKCLEYFGTACFYDVLNIPKTANSKEIKKAYHKLSLIVHPDRVSDNQKELATEKFKILGKIHAVLQDESKRKLYDEHGELYEDDDNDFNWVEYWRKLFKKIEIQDIIDYEKNYIGSDIEKGDIKKAYVGTKGDMNKMLEMIPFSNCENEERIQLIVRQMIDNEEVEEYDGFFNEPTAKKKRRHRKYALQKKEAEKIDISEVEKLSNEICNKAVSRFSDMIGNLEEKYLNNKKKAIKNTENRRNKRRKNDEETVPTKKRKTRSQN